MRADRAVGGCEWSCGERDWAQGQVQPSVVRVWRVQDLACRAGCPFASVPGPAARFVEAETSRGAGASDGDCPRVQGKRPLRWKLADLKHANGPLRRATGYK